MNISSLLKYLQPLRDKDYTVYLETSYYYVPIEDIDVRNGIIILNTGQYPLVIKPLVKVLLQQDDCTLVIVQDGISIFHVVAIEILYNTVVLIINYKKNLW